MSPGCLRTFLELLDGQQLLVVEGSGLAEFQVFCHGPLQLSVRVDQKHESEVTLKLAILDPRVHRGPKIELSQTMKKT